MPRKLPEWIGKTDDAALPARVQLRILERDQETCQGPCHRRLRPGDLFHFDHKTPLKDGGLHAESNIQVMCKGCHLLKTGFEARARAITNAIKKCRLGIKPPSKFPNARTGKWKTRIGGRTALRTPD